MNKLYPAAVISKNVFNIKVFNLYWQNFQEGHFIELFVKLFKTTISDRQHLTCIYAG